MFGVCAGFAGEQELFYLVHGTSLSFLQEMLSAGKILVLPEQAVVFKSLTEVV